MTIAIDNEFAQRIRKTERAEWLASALATVLEGLSEDHLRSLGQRYWAYYRAGLDPAGDVFRLADLRAARREFNRRYPNIY